VKPLLLGLLLSGCATTHLTERYVIAGDAQSLVRAAEEASVRLGWATTASEGGKFHVLFYPRHSRTSSNPLTIGAEDDVLRIEGDQERHGAYLPEAAQILAGATAELMGQRAPGPKVEERSAAITVALDLIFPAAGALYALHGDPYFDSGVVKFGRGVWWEFMGRLGIDLASGLLISQTFAFRRVDGSPMFPLWTLVTPIFTMVTIRLMSLVTDLTELPFRNAYARSGLSAPVDP
jgi:hypothetical protein